MKKNILYIIVVVLVFLMFVIVYFVYHSLTATHKAPASDSTTETAANVIPADDFYVIDADGNQVELSDYFGKPIIINFWATWCGPCQSELQSFDDLYNEYGDDVQFMMVDLTDGSKDTVESVKSFVEENGYTFPVYFDTESNAAETYGVYSIPMTIVINADGNIKNRYIGAMDAETIEEYLMDIL